MEIWEKKAWIHDNCKFASNIPSETKVTSYLWSAFHAACRQSNANDAEAISNVAHAFFKKAVMDISSPTSNPLAKNPMDAILTEIRPMLDQEFEKAKALRKGQPLLSPDITRLTMMGFRMLQEKLKQRGINIRDLVSLRTIVQDVVEELASGKRDTSMALPGKDRFMHDKPTRSVEDLARLNIDNFTGTPKARTPLVPPKGVPGNPSLFQTKIRDEMAEKALGIEKGDPVDRRRTDYYKRKAGSERWLGEVCKFAQGTPAPQDDMKSRVAQSFSILFNEALTPAVNIRDYSIDGGSKGSFDEEPYGAFVEDLDAVLSFKPQPMVKLSDEADWLGVPTPADAHKAIMSVLPVNIKVMADTSVDDFDLRVEGEISITGLGPMMADGSCSLVYAPNPIPVTGYDHR